MRELKFRIWEEREKAYDTWSYILDESGNLCRNVYGALIGCDKKDYIVEQYTGLKDKNGKEIYENDIVDDGFSRICEIRWSEHSTEFEAINENDGYVTSIWFVAQYGEVIGNIHENADLLGEEK